MFPIEPLREDLDRGIRLAATLAQLKTAVLNSFMSLNFDNRNHAIRLDTLQPEVVELRRRTQDLDRRIGTLQREYADMSNELARLKRKPAERNPQEGT